MERAREEACLERSVLQRAFCTVRWLAGTTALSIAASVSGGESPPHPPASPPLSPQALADLIEQLGSEAYKVRAAAHATIRRSTLDTEGMPLLRNATTHESLERSRRAQQLFAFHHERLLPQLRPLAKKLAAKYKDIAPRNCPDGAWLWREALGHGFRPPGYISSLSGKSSSEICSIYLQRAEGAGAKSDGSPHYTNYHVATRILAVDWMEAAALHHLFKEDCDVLMEREATALRDLLERMAIVDEIYRLRYRLPPRLVPIPPEPKQNPLPKQSRSHRPSPPFDPIDLQSIIHSAQARTVLLAQRYAHG